MVDLPPALDPWAADLEMFGDVVHEGVGEWLLPLRNLLGPMAVPRSAVSGDPDGFSGLSRRGPYDRLLLSEWAIALEVPEEFLRRAVMGEHMFIAPAFREPQGAHTSVALVDCGPLQLGSPRLAHLAALIVLQRRAAESGAAFVFGVLQDRETSLRGLERPAVPWWIRMRSWDAGDVALDAWEGALAELAPDDVWLLGAPSLLAAANRLGAGLLDVQEVLEPGARSLLVRSHRRGSAGNQRKLELPPADTCVRIFRGPLAAPRPRPIHETLPESLRGAMGQLSLDGRRLFLPRVDGGINAYHVPNTPKDVRGRTKQVPPRSGFRLAAADLHGRRIVALAVRDDDELLLLGSGLHDDDGGESRSIHAIVATGLKVPPSMALHDDEEPQLATMYVTQAVSGRFQAWILDLRLQLWELNLHSAHPIPTPSDILPKLEIRERACRSLRRVDHAQVMWVSDSQHAIAGSMSWEVEERVNRHADVDGQLRTVVFGRAIRGARYTPTGAFSHRSADKKTYVFGAEDFVVDSPRGSVFGLHTVSTWRDHGYTEVPVLLALDGREVTSTREGQTKVLFTSPEPIANIIHEPTSGRILWCTESDVVGVYSLEREAILLRLLPGEGAGEP